MVDDETYKKQANRCNDVGWVCYGGHNCDICDIRDKVNAQFTQNKQQEGEENNVELHCAVPESPRE